MNVKLKLHFTFQAKQISAAYDEKHDAKSLVELKKFVSKLPHMQAERKALEIQTAIAGLVGIIVCSCL